MRTLNVTSGVLSVVVKSTNGKRDKAYVGKALSLKERNYLASFLGLDLSCADTDVFVAMYTVFAKSNPKYLEGYEKATSDDTPATAEEQKKIAAIEKKFSDNTPARQ